jgi:hypothetical protein
LRENATVITEWLLRCTELKNSLEGKYQQKTLGQRHTILFTSHALCVDLRRGQLLRERSHVSAAIITVIKNGPVNIFATTDKRVTVGENCKVKVLSVTLIGGESKITTTGKIIN